MTQAQTIQRTFCGLTLGETTLVESQKTLLLQGFTQDSMVGDPSILLYNKENIEHCGILFDNLITQGANDTLFSVIFMTNVEETEINGMLKSMKKALAVNDSMDAKNSFIASFLLDSMLHTIPNIKEVQAWVDDRTMVILGASDTGILCWYVNYEVILQLFYNIFMKTVPEELEQLPDYAEENKVYGVGGTKFGDSKERVKEVMRTRGNFDYSSDTHSINYKDVKIGGITYQYVTFYFKNGKLVSVNMQQPFYEWRDTEAKMMYENVSDQYKRKYSNFKELLNDEDDKLSTCGAYIDGYDYKPIHVSLDKSLSKGGDIMYYVIVDYYYNNRSGLYDDDI